jgi:8-amino-7-oxononanoate synthase
VSDRDRAAIPLENAQSFTDLTGLPRAQSPIVPIVLGSADRALAARARLEQHGFLVPAIRPPTVPAGQSRLRVAFTAMHTQPDIRDLADAFSALVLAG